MLDGGTGDDVLRGGFGSDTYFVDDSGDVVEETGGRSLSIAGNSIVRARLGYDNQEGHEPEAIADDVDEVISTVSYALTDFVENLTLDGNANLDGTGNSLDNTIVGNDGVNVLRTGEGEFDILSGGAGADTFIVDKIIGHTTIEDTPGDADVLDLLLFVGDGELQFRDIASGTLRIDNGIGGVVEIDGFYASDERSIKFLDLGDGQIDISGADTAADVAEASQGGAAPGGGSGSESQRGLIDPNDDGLLFDADIQTDDGQLIQAAEAQVFRTFLGGLGRPPDTEGFDFWLTEVLEGRHTLSSMAAGFVSSDEFQVIADSDDNGEVSSSEFWTTCIGTCSDAHPTRMASTSGEGNSIRATVVKATCLPKWRSPTST